MPTFASAYVGPNKTGEAHHSFFRNPSARKAIETSVFWPTYALANVGHASSSYWVLLGN